MISMRSGKSSMQNSMPFQTYQVRVSANQACKIFSVVSYSFLEKGYLTGLKLEKCLSADTLFQPVLSVNYHEASPTCNIASLKQNFLFWTAYLQRVPDLGPNRLVRFSTNREEKVGTWIRPSLKSAESSIQVGVGPCSELCFMSFKFVLLVGDFLNAKFTIPLPQSGMLSLLKS